MRADRRHRTPELVELFKEPLLRAIQRYDWRHGGRFVTYAMWWIRQAILRAIANHRRSVRLPVHVDLEIQRIRRATRELANDLGRQPSLDEIAAHLGVGAQRVSGVLVSSRATVSLQAPLGDEDGEPLDIVPDTCVPLPEDVAVWNDLAWAFGAPWPSSRTESKSSCGCALRSATDGSTPSRRSGNIWRSLGSACGSSRSAPSADFAGALRSSRRCASDENRPALQVERGRIDASIVWAISSASARSISAGCAANRSWCTAS